MQFPNKMWCLVVGDVKQENLNSNKFIRVKLFTAKEEGIQSFRPMVISFQV